MSYIRKSVRLESSVYKEVEKISGGNFNRWINLLIDRELKLDGGKSSADDLEKKITSEKLDVLLDENLIKVLNEKGGEVMGSLSDLELARLAVQRAPKAKDLDYEHEEALLNLKGALKHLPDVEDLRKELIRVKGELKRVKIEYEVELSSIRSLRMMFTNLGESGEGLFNGVRELCREIAEKSYDLRGEDELRDLVDRGIEVLRLTSSGLDREV